jgi:hypothetical protein
MYWINVAQDEHGNNPLGSVKCGSLVAIEQLAASQQLSLSESHGIRQSYKN